VSLAFTTILPRLADHPDQVVIRIRRVEILAMR
jgi:hypothetical protein